MWIRLQSHSPVELNLVTDEEVALILSEGNASLKSKGATCPAYGSADLGAGLTLA